MTGGSPPARRSIQQRLFLVLAFASALVAVASLVAIFAMSRIRSEFESVSARELPETTAALRLAQIGERLQGRAPALIAAADEDQRKAQMRLIATDLKSLGEEVERLKAAETRETALIDAISANALALRENLTAIGELLATRSALANRLRQDVVLILALQDGIRQALGPSILAITDAVGRGITKAEPQAHAAAGKSSASGRPLDTFTAAVTAQAPLLEAERLGDAAINSLLIAIEAGGKTELDAAFDRYWRTVAEWRSLLPRMPAGLRAPLQSAVADLTDQISGPESAFRLRQEELATLAHAGELIAVNRQLADQLSSQVDRLVASANATVSRAAQAIDRTIVHHTFLLAGLSAAAIVAAVLISYLVVIRDLGAGMRGVTAAMMRLARGEHDVAVPATDRPDEIGDLARAFVVFGANARRMETLDRQLVEKSNLLVATFDNMNDGFSVYDGDARLLEWNAQFVRLYDLPKDALVPGTPIEDIQKFVADRGAIFRTAGRQVAAQELSAQRLLKTQHFEVDLSNGHTIELRSNPIPSGGFVSIHIDVTERKAIEMQLRQAQKMEMVGQLTGGLAHDFNNLLAVIQGNLHLLQDQLQEQPELQESVSRALAAGERAAMQIERLLAFSRRQKLRPEIVDVGVIIPAILDLLEYSVGPDVVVRTDLADDLPPVLVDLGQLENALLNLALNARDAMDGHGTLTIGARPTSGAEPVGGAFVEIAVHDSGRGMLPDVVEHAIEPFFTTKAPGKGSGLGLSMVYGFVRQSGGTFRIESAPGSGSSIIFTLPVPVDFAGTPPPPAAVVCPDGRLPREPAGETILVVEDDASLREAVASQIRQWGYRVIEAESAAVALERLRAGPDIRVIYTDVILGKGADGFALAREARAIRPSLRTLYTSAERFTAGEAMADTPESVNILQKPVSPGVLAAALAGCLEEAAEAQTSSTTASNT